MKKHNQIILFIAIIFLAISRVFNPFEEDQKIFFASAHISNGSIFNFPKNIIETFELKPFFSQLFYYLMYKISIPLNLWEDKLKFIYFIQFFFLLSILLVSFLFSRIKHVPQKNKNNIFFITSFFLITVGSESFLQVEHVAIVLSILCIWLLSKNKIQYDIFAGIILGYIAGLKGITVFYSLATILFCFFYFKKNLIVTSFVFFIVFIFSLYLSYEDIETARLLQGNNFNIFRFFENYKKTWKLILVDQSYLFTTGIYSMHFLYYSIKTKRLKLNFNVLYSPMTMIIILLLPSIILQVGFTYHYFAILLITIFLILFSVKTNKDCFNNNKIGMTDLRLLIPSFLIYVLFSTNLFNHKKNLCKTNISNFNSEIVVSNLLKEQIATNEKVLFLTDGVINFYIDNKSAYYEFYPITINRLMPSFPKIPEKLEYRYLEILDFIKKYNGNFILIQTNWFPFDQYNKIYPNSSYSIVSKLSTNERNYFLYKRNK